MNGLASGGKAVGSLGHSRVGFKGNNGIHHQLKGVHTARRIQMMRRFGIGHLSVELHQEVDAGGDQRDARSA